MTIRNTDDLERLFEETEEELAPVFRRAEKTAFKNQKKVMDAFIKNRVAAEAFNPTSG